MTIVPWLLLGAGLGVLLLGIVFLATIATRERKRDQASLRRIRARIFAHACPLCGIVHGGVGQ